MKNDVFIIKWYHIFTFPYFLIRRGIDKKVKQLSKKITGNILDFGCGAKPYHRYFDHVEKYTGLDIETSGHSHINEQIDVYYDGKIIPFDNNSFDGVFSSEVFEHIFNLEEILSEINRVLKPGGKMLFTCPFSWPEHEQPYDFARYSSFGIKAIMERNGFNVVEQYKTGNFFEVVMQYIVLYISYFIPKRPAFIYYILHQLFILPFLLFAVMISAILPKKLKRKDLYFNNVLLVEKKY